MKRWRNRVAVVTGASSGIGEAIAADLVRVGLKVVALGRRIERLEANRLKLAKGLQHNFHVRQCDVTNESEVKAIFEWIERTLGGTDILVNNAGCMRMGCIVDMDTVPINEVIDTNVKGLIYCTQAAFRSMKERKFDGHILHINSVAGHQPNISVGSDVHFNVYHGSKHAVTAINETIRSELRCLGTKIRTTSISPGLVRTEMVPQSFLDSFGEAVLNAEDVSQAVLFAISAPPHVQIHEVIIRPVGECF